MRRAPIVVTASVAGLAAVLSFHTKPIGSLAAASGPLTSSNGAGPGPSTGNSSTATRGAIPSASGPTTGAPATAGTAPAGSGASPSTTAARPPTSSPAPAATSSPAAGTSSGSHSSAATPTTSAGSGSTSGSSHPTATTSPPTTQAPTTTTTAGNRTATGQYMQYRYGDIQLKVFVTGNRITDIKTVVDDANDPQSYQINENAIPQLRQQALQAQSSNIDGVSGATYTSQAYVDSLQSALDQLGWNN